MSPLEICLVLRVYAMPAPNRDLPKCQAYAPAMREAVNSFKKAGIFTPDASLDSFYHGEKPSPQYLTPRGEKLIQTLMAVDL